MSKWCVGACLIFLLLLTAGPAHAQANKGCPQPNPNINAPPFFDGCPIPAATLNRLFQGAYGGLVPGVKTCATVTVNAAGYIQSVVSGTCGGGPTGAVFAVQGGNFGVQGGLYGVQ